MPFPACSFSLLIMYLKIRQSWPHVRRKMNEIRVFLYRISFSFFQFSASVEKTFLEHTCSINLSSFGLTPILEKTAVNTKIHFWSSFRQYLP